MLELPATLPFFKLGPSGVPFIEMLEFCRYRYRSGNSPSGVPFLEVLELVPAEP